MAPACKPTGFFDLPLELRQAIYTHMLPSGRYIRYSLLHSENAPENTAIAVCAAHPVLYQELWDWLYTHCGAVLTFSPDREIDLPYGVEWHRFQFICIEIDYMTRSGTLPENWTGLQKTISSLLHGQPKRLPTTMIQFLEGDNPYRGSLWATEGDDAYEYTSWQDIDHAYARTNWYESMPAGESHRSPKVYEMDCSCDDESCFGDCDDSEDSDDDDLPPVTCLRTIGCEAEPIAVLVLEAFLQLPPCKSVNVQGLEKLGLGHRAEDHKIVVDWIYWMNICFALEFWLEGKREGITLPKERDKFGRPVLEQLAYLPVGGCMAFCDLEDDFIHGTLCDCYSY